MSEETRQPPETEYRRVTEDVLRAMGARGPGYLAALGVTGAMALAGLAAWGFQLALGMGVAGYTHPVMWAVYITNFVWWIGIAHSGTLLSAILFLFRAPFRAAFSRSAEAMTLIAIGIGALFPILHLGRAWRFYWLLPYPNERHLWVNFRSPLILDVFAILTYLIVSVLFFWLGLLPDLALVRDRARGWSRTIYGALAAGWEGTGRQWKHHQMAYSVLAGLAATLVISVHSIVAWDFGTSLVPTWHATIFAPYFVAGAMFSGLGMVLTLLIPLQSLLRLQEYITVDRLEQIARLLLMMSLALTLCYALEYFTEWYGGEPAEIANLLNKARGSYATQFRIFTACNSLAPLALCWRPFRRCVPALFLLSIAVNVGMWLERFVIIAGGLARDYLPSTWSPSDYRATLVEAAISIGSLGWFLFCFLLFARYLPALPIADLKREWLKKRREETAIAAVPAATRVEALA